METKRLVIIADRYADSTTAYQGYGRRLSIELVNATNKLATQGLMPHKTFLLDLTPEEGLRRAGSDKREFFELGPGREAGRGGFQALRGGAARVPRACEKGLPRSRREVNPTAG